MQRHLMEFFFSPSKPTSRLKLRRGSVCAKTGMSNFPFSLNREIGRAAGRESVLWVEEVQVGVVAA